MGSSAAGGATGSPRLDVVFGLRQCDKKNHGWREGPPRPSLAQFRSAGRAFTLPAKSVRTKKEYSFALLPANLSLKTLAGYRRPSARSVAGHFGGSRVRRPSELRPFRNAGRLIAGNWSLQEAPTSDSPLEIPIWGAYLLPGVRPACFQSGSRAIRGFELKRAPATGKNPFSKGPVFDLVDLPVNMSSCWEQVRSKLPQRRRAFQHVPMQHDEQAGASRHLITSSTSSMLIACKKRAIQSRIAGHQGVNQLLSE